MAPRTRPWPLSHRIVSLVLLNLALIALVLVFFAYWLFGLRIESIALGPARARLISLATEIGRSLDAAPYTQKSAVLAEYSEKYGVDLSLVGLRGRSLTGVQAELPKKLLGRIRGAPLPGRAPPLEGSPGESENPRRGEPLSGLEPPPRANGRPAARGERGFVPLGGRPEIEKAFFSVTRSPLLYWVGVRIPTIGPQGERGVPAVLLFRTNSILNRTLFFEWRSLVWLGVVLAAVALLCWWPFVHGVTRSIRQMDRVTDRIALGQFESRVNIRRSDELGHLAEQINRLALRLEGFVKHQKRFLGDIAHELCSPIARIQFALGILEQRASDAQEEHVTVLRDEIQEMSALVNELLMFSKAGMQPAETTLKSIELGPVVNNAIAHQLPGAGIIEASIPPELRVLAYEPYLLRAVSNLLRNGLRYAGDEGPILVTARHESGRVLLMVSDCGPGLPEEEIESVFEPFYRPESARSRHTGGAGLGLAIVKSCIEACRGTVTCRNRQPSGLEVTIALAESNGQN